MKLKHDTRRHRRGYYLRTRTENDCFTCFYLVIAGGGMKADYRVSGDLTQEQAYRAWCEARIDGKAMKRTNNVRFWEFLNNDWVKITMHPGQRITHGKSYDNGEGWTSEWSTFEHHGDHLECEYGSDGRDCDGRMSTGGRLSVGLDRLASRKAFRETTTEGDQFHPFGAPDWKPLKSWQRDYAAEAANY